VLKQGRGSPPLRSGEQGEPPHAYAFIASVLLVVELQAVGPKDACNAGASVVFMRFYAGLHMYNAPVTSIQSIAYCAPPRELGALLGHRLPRLLGAALAVPSSALWVRQSACIPFLH